MASAHDRRNRISRRAVLLAGLAAPLLAPGHARASGGPKPLVPVAEWLHRPEQPPFRIPDDYIGLHSDHGLGAATPAPAYPFDAVRSHDTDDGDGFPALQWARIEREPGRYDWRAVDAWIAAHAGRTRLFVLFGCPVFYQKYPREPWRYPYLAGGGSPPKEPEAAARFVRALCDRHPGQIRYVELWNEPNLGPGRSALSRWLPNMPQPGFFTGTAGDLAQLARVVKAALPPGVGLMACAWEGQAKDGGPSNSLRRFSEASDGAGGFGRDHVDALSVHSYTYDNQPNGMISELRAYRQRFAEARYRRDLPLHVTEIGAEAPAAWTTAHPSLDVKVVAIRRWLLIPAALGFSSAYLYKHSVMTTLGDPARTPAIGEAIADIRRGIRGRTVVGAARLTDDSIWIAFTDGSAVTA